MQPALAGLHFEISGQIIEVLGLGIRISGINQWRS
jgi:hypothetical protein